MGWSNEPLQKDWSDYKVRYLRNIAWIEQNCLVPSGKDVGRPVRLRWFQRWFLRALYSEANNWRRVIFSVGRKNAKALSLDTPIPTPGGWKTMEDIEAGDQVYGDDGSPVTVTDTSEIFYGKDCYKLTFSDGSTIVASGDHRWETTHKYRPWDGTRGRSKTGVVTTEQIAESVKYPRPDGGNENNHKICLAPATESKDLDLPIDPYVLGAWLGDGSSHGARFTCSESDLDYMTKVLSKKIGADVTVSLSATRAPTINAPDLHKKLRLSGLLKNKHIPAAYFDAGTEQRWELLRGLMDTDGTVNKCGGKTTARCSFTNKRHEISHGLWRIARSLGLKATIKEKRAYLRGKDCGPIWIVSFPAAKTSPVFGIPRKQSLLPDSLGTRSGSLSIVSCERVESVPCKCIAVDNDSHLFLAGYGCVPTHNTATSALVVVLNVAGPEAESKINAEFYSTAQSRDQAALVFNLAAKIIRLSPGLNDFLTIRDTLKEIYNPHFGILYKALSADAPTAYGLSPALAIHDELGQVKGPKFPLYEAVETATAAHEQPLSIIISTQAPSDGDLLSILIDDAGASDSRTKLILFTAPEDMDPFSEESVRRANPGLGDLQNQSEVMGMANDARRMPSREAEYRNLVLNQRVEAHNPFVTKAVWQLSGDFPEARGECYGGLDLSETNDLTALELVFPGKHYDVKSHFWLPGQGLVERARQDRVPYDLWKKEGHLFTTPGASIEYEYVAQVIADLFNKYDIKKIAFDRYNMRHLKPWLIKAGMSESFIDDRFQDFGQGYVSMSPALRNLESLLLNARLRHGNHPILTMCAANAVVKTDEAGNRKLDKSKSRGRIDGMVALAMAAAIASEEAGKANVFPVEEEDILE